MILNPFSRQAFNTLFPQSNTNLGNFQSLLDLPINVFMALQRRTIECDNLMK